MAPADYIRAHSSLLLPCGSILSVARSGDELFNSLTAERIVFRKTAVETNGALLEMDDYWEAPGHRAPEHIHPQMQERWEVIAGTARFRIDGVERSAGPGDVVIAPPGVRHMAWNPGTKPVHLRVQMRPALRWEIFVERLFALLSGPAASTPQARDSLLELMREFPAEIALPPPRSE
jgi:quercetin dioxygenase-like cupin family protein